jgi:predicted Zn-dependent peptidase
MVALGLLGGGPSWAQPGSPPTPPPSPGGPTVLQPAWRGEQGERPRLLVQTVPDAQVTATVLAVRYRRPHELGAPTSSAAHLLEHLLFRSRAGQPPGALLVRSESLGGQSLAYLTSGLLVLGELVPSEQGLESLELQLERLRALPSDPTDLQQEKRAIASEIARARLGPEEQGRRELLARLGVDARVEGEASTVEALTAADLEALWNGLNLEQDVVIAVVGPHSARQVLQRLEQRTHRLKPARTQGRTRTESQPSPPPLSEVVSPSGFQQESLFLALPELSTAERLLLEELLGQLKEWEGRPLRLALVKEEQGLYRLDVSPPLQPPELVRLLESLKVDDQQLGQRLRRRWLDRYEPALERAEMLALEVLERNSLAQPLPAQEVAPTRQRLVRELQEALPRAARLRLRSEGEPAVEGFYPFLLKAQATPTGLQRERLPNGLTVAWQDLKGWPVVGISGFFRLRQPLSPEECARLEARLEARSAAGLDYDIKPEALFFHLWCPSDQLTDTLEEAAAEIRTLSQSSEVLLNPSSEVEPPGPLEDFFLRGLTRPEAAPISGRTLLYPELGQLVLVGDIDPLALDHGLRPAWNGWFAERPPRAAGAVSLAEPPAEMERTVAVPAGQAPLLLLGVWGPSRSNPDFLAFNLVLQTLAGRPTTSILARSLRDADGLLETLSVFPLTGSERSDGQQLWLLAARPQGRPEEARPLAERLAVALAIPSREPLPEAELARTRAYLKATLRLSTATARGRARMLANSEFYRLSEQYSTDFAGLYDRIEPSHARAVWQKYLQDQTPRWLYLRPEPPAP